MKFYSRDYKVTNKIKNTHTYKQSKNNNNNNKKSNPDPSDCNITY